MFFKRINIQEFIDEIKFICNLNQEQYQTLSQNIYTRLQYFSQLSPQQEISNIRQSIHQSENPVLSNAVENLSSRSEVGPNGSQQIPHDNRFRLINLTGENPQPRGRGPIIQAHNSSSTITGVGPMEVVKFIGFVISIPFRIIFFFMQLAG